MDMAFLVKMKQSNKCGSVRNDEIINLHLLWALDSRFSLPPARHQPHLLILPTQTINQ